MEILLILILVISSINCDCDANSGPSGITECILIPRYNNMYQWATCLTDIYIRTKNHNQWQCEDRSNIYCYYQCMVELHNTNDGPVLDDCLCKSGEKHQTWNLTLPYHCYSPSGVDCTWYKDCLETKYACSGTEDDYGMKYATKFCDLYNEHYNQFSNDGQIWIDAVRKCLQVSLVPILRPWRSLSCKQIKQIAFDSHVPCYIHPDKSRPRLSICNLGVSDFFSVFWTIKSSLIMSVDSGSETIKGFWHTMLDCRDYLKNYAFDEDVRNIRLSVMYELPENRRRRSIDLANKIADQLADRCHWMEDGVVWFAEADVNYTLSQSNLMQLNIFLANKNKFDLNAKHVASANLTATIIRFQNKVQNGELIANTGDVSYNIVSAEGCTDIGCKEISFNAISPDDKKGECKEIITNQSKKSKTNYQVPKYKTTMCLIYKSLNFTVLSLVGFDKQLVKFRIDE